MSSESIEDVLERIEKSVKSSNPRELTLKGFSFGRLLYNVGDYNKAVEWIAKYLRKYDRDPQAHKLLGECYENLAEYEAALASYKQSLQLKPSQYDLVVHIAELFLNPGPTQNPTKAQVWLDKAIAALPGNSTVFKMKMELLVAQQAPPQTLEESILKELKLRPNDPLLHVQYVTFMKTQDRMEDAYLYCNTISNIRDYWMLENNYKWCSCVVKTYEGFISSSKSNMANSQDFFSSHCLLLEALSRLIWLCIAENKQNKASEKLRLMDQYLYDVAVKNLTNEWKTVVEEMKGQFSWLVATFIIHQADNYLPWKEATKLATYFYSHSLSKPTATSSSEWAVFNRKSLPKLISRLQKIAGIRLSQCSHMMRSIAVKAGDQWRTLTEYHEDPVEIGTMAFEKLFRSSDSGKSYLCSGHIIVNNIDVPSVSAMLHYDEIAAMCKDLKMLVWLGMRWLELEDSIDFLPWATKAFPNLKLNSGTQTISSVLSVNILDAESFIAGCVFSTEKQSVQWKELSVDDDSALSCVNMPLALCRRLTTDLQDKWWTSALTLTAPSKLRAPEVSKLKPIMQRGLQCLRGIGNHGLEITLITKLATYFAAKAFAILESSGASAAWYAYQRRAAMYWSLAIPELNRLSEGVATFQAPSKDNLFPLVFKELSTEAAKSLLSEAYMCRGELAAQEGRNDEALSLYGKATIPQASFCQAHIYKQMYEKLRNGSQSDTPLVDIGRQMELYTKKYRHYLEITLNRLQQHPDESLHERTVHLLRSPHVSPQRVSANRSANDSSILLPSKQSTPKMNESADKLLSNLVEKESVTNLVDTITTLTSALSSLQMEVSYLREDNRMMRQSSPGAGSFNHTPLRPQAYEMMHGSNRPFTPTMRLPHEFQRQPAPPVTPQPYMPSNSAAYPGLSKDGLSGTPNPMQQSQYFDAQQPYQQQSQTYYNRSVSNFTYQDFSDEKAMLGNEYPAEYQKALPPGVAAQGYPAAYSPNLAPAAVAPTYPASQQPNNFLAASLQNIDTSALQHKFGSMFSGAPKSAEERVDKSLQKESSYQETDVRNLLKQQPSTPVTGSSNKQLLLQQLLLEGKGTLTTTLVVNEDADRDSGSSISTPIVSKPAVQFLHNFVSPKSPGTNMKFQSPEQMDRENQELDALEQADVDTSRHNDTGPHFDPIIPLPDEIEVKTGEEEEDVIFSERCKLYRYVDSQWKERGIGQMKLLKHITSGKARLVMRREQVLKLCCNHAVAETTHLVPMSSSDRAMVWHALDFAEEDEGVHEKFAAKFKTSEIAQAFRDAVSEEAANVPEDEEEEEYSTGTTGVLPPSTVQSSSNTATSQTLEHGAAKFKFEMPKPSPVAQALLVDTKKEEHSKPSPFQGLANALSSSGFGSSGPNGGIMPGSKIFSFGPPKPKPKEANTKSDAKTEEKDPGSEPESPYVREETDGDPHYKPVIDLPKLVELKTGEEDEEVVFQRRAKLFRYASTEWKERGLGDMKILKHKTTGKYRIVMRREQVLKICANHNLSPGMTLSPQGSSQKAWVWSALDYSESLQEPERETFAIKFKTMEDAKEFFDKFVEGTKAKSEEVVSLFMPPPVTTSQAASAFFKKDVAQQLEKGTQKQTFGFQFGVDSAPKFGFGEIIPAMGSWDQATTNAKPASQNISSYSVPKDTGVITSNSGSGFNFAISPAPVQQGVVQFGVSEPTTVAPTDVPPKNNTAPIANTTVADANSKGLNPPPKQPGWECPHCSLLNTEDGEMCSCCDRSNPNRTTQPQPKGFNLPPKPVGSWQCPGCLASNGPEQEKCLCCQHSNPNLETQSKPAQNVLKEDKVIMQFGTNMNTPASTTSPFSFGIPQPASNQSEAAKSTTVAPTDVPPKNNSAPIGNTSVADASSKGFNLPPKPVGSWQCPGCLASNGPEQEKCLCCQHSNPNLETHSKPAQNVLKEDKVIMQFGTNMNTPASTTSPFSFGIPQPASNQSEVAKSTTVAPTDVPPKNDSAPIGNTSVADVSSKGFNLPPKPVGSWQCPGCLASNGPEQEKCLCCQHSNPNLETQAKPGENVVKEEKVIMQFGTNMNTPASTTSPFSFGIPQPASNQSEVAKSEETNKQHPSLQRTGGSNQTTPYYFGFGNSGTPFASQNVPTFASTPFCDAFQVGNQSSAPPQNQPAKPRFPIDYGEDDSEDYDDETTSSSDDSQYERYLEAEERAMYESNYTSTVSHQSPLNRFAEQKPQNIVSSKESDNDVICVGEVLPSKELQDKAKELQLPPHFYNYLEKDGETKKEANEDSDSSETERVSSSVASTSIPTTSTSIPSVLGSTASVSFAQLASQSTSGFSFNIKPSDKKDPAWTPDTKPMFATHANTPNPNNESGEYYQEDDGDHIHVKPIVELPENVTIETGEENETTLFSRRAKLFRFHKDSAQWKERGVGDVMIKHHTTNDTFRVLMRREQVLKVCANHLITTEIKLEPCFGSDRAWTWLAVDFSEGEEAVEKLAIRFKTPDIAQEFKDQFEECQVLLQKRNDVSGSDEKKSSVSTLIDNAEKMKSELGFFKDKLSAKTKVDLQNTFTEDLNKTGADVVAPNVQLTPLVKQHEMDKEKKQRESRIPRPVTENKTQKEITLESAKEPAKSSIELNKFAFTMKPDASKTPESVRGRQMQQRNISVCSTTSEESQADIHFEPIISLPEKVPVRTGEENDLVLFEERAKLYIFDRDGQAWKERGLGCIKILQDKTSFKLRLVMRREQVLKVCLNHHVTRDIKIEYKVNTQNVLLWTATDFSDSDKPEGEMCQFALRFKAIESASSFLLCITDGMDAVDEKRLLDPMPERDLSVVSEQQNESTHSRAEEAASPIKSPVKNVKPLFSFANVESPFAKKYENFGGNFVFGDTPSTKPAATAPGKFTFDTSAISFNFGSTSTPSAPPPVAPASPAPDATKPTSSKSLFGPALVETDVSKAPLASAFSFQLNKDAPSLSTANAVDKKATEETEHAGEPGAATFASEKQDNDETKKEDSADDNDDDVIFVWEAKPTDEQRKRAEELFLPLTFFCGEDYSSEDDLSDREDAILSFINRRDTPESSDSSDTEEEEQSKSDVEDVDESRSEEGDSSYASSSQQDESSTSAQNISQTASTGNLFQNYVSEPGFSFFSAANAASNKHAFGTRKDAAFNVSAASKVLFSKHGEEEADPEANNPDYKPVLAELPPLIDVKTGEEEEEIIFKDRCKLFIFDAKTVSWKERGLGELKILHHQPLNAYRVVMRREQVLKVCANHGISKHMRLLANGEKAWMYVAQNKDEDNVTSVVKFTVRFKTPEIAAKFREAWEDAQADME